MAVTVFWYGLAFSKMLNKEIDWLADDIRISLHHDYSPNQDTHEYFDDVVASECADGSGYAHMGMALPTPTLAYDAGTNVVKLSADPATWVSSTIHATHAVIWDHAPGTDSTDPLICYVDFGGDVDSTIGDFTITWNAGGILTITPA